MSSTTGLGQSDYVSIPFQVNVTIPAIMLPVYSKVNYENIGADLSIDWETYLRLS